MKFSKAYINTCIANIDTIGYHGTNSNFSKFLNSEDGIYFTNKPEFATSYGNNIIKARIKINNPLILPYEWFNTRNPTPAEIKKLGYDGFVVETPYGAAMYVIFNAAQATLIPNKETKTYLLQGFRVRKIIHTIKLIIVKMPIISSII